MKQSVNGNGTGREKPNLPCNAVAKKGMNLGSSTDHMALGKAEWRNRIHITNKDLLVWFGNSTCYI